MKKLYKRVIISAIILITTIVIGNQVYNYGAHIGYEITATTVSGKTIVLPSEWLHLEYTPWYLTAVQFRAFVDILSISFLTMFNVIYTVSNYLISISTIFGMAYWLYRRLFSNRDPSSMVNGGPYKIF